MLVWKLDRLGRSVLDLARNVDEFRRAGVRLIAVTHGIDLDPERPDAAAKGPGPGSGSAVLLHRQTLVPPLSSRQRSNAQRTVR